MTIALFGKSISDSYLGYLQQLIDHLSDTDGCFWIYKPFAGFLEGKIRFSRPPVPFTKAAEIAGKASLCLSIGGDGTILEAVSVIRDSGIPIAGINMGHLGFLSSISREEILPAIREIREKKYHLDQRTLLRLETPSGLFGDLNFALNELAVHKSNVQTLLTIKTYINGQFLNKYWADGLIIATPTGSTAYSLSCMGPILTPDSENFVITPIASHNLTVRPIVVRDTSRIRITVESNANEFMVSLDSRVEKVTSGLELNIFKAGFTIQLVRLSNSGFFETIREKLKWGLDIRN
jgi:NAD+ kinase